MFDNKIILFQHIKEMLIFRNKGVTYLLNSITPAFVQEADGIAKFYFVFLFY